MLRLDDQTGQMLPVVHYGPHKRPVYPHSVWGLHSMHAVCLDISPPISLIVDSGCGELHQVNLPIPLQFILLAGPI